MEQPYLHRYVGTRCYELVRVYDEHGVLDADASYWEVTPLDGHGATRRVTFAAYKRFEGPRAGDLAHFADEETTAEQIDGWLSAVAEEQAYPWPVPW